MVSGPSARSTLPRCKAAVSIDSRPIKINAEATPGRGHPDRAADAGVSTQTNGYYLLSVFKAVPASLSLCRTASSGDRPRRAYRGVCFNAPAEHGSI